MNKKNTEKEEIIEEEVISLVDEEVAEEEVKLDLDFAYDKIDFAGISEEEKAKVFEKLKSQNFMVLAVLKEMESKIKELEAKSVSRVSEEQYQRLLADFENHKRRNESARSSAFLDGKLDILKSLLPLCDSFERGISMVTDENSKKAMQMMQKSCQDILVANEVEEINPAGEDFNPNFHNAVMQEEADDKAMDDKVVEVFQKGYKKGDKVLRYAQVKVAKA